MNNITVHIPYKDTKLYTLYALGCTIDKQEIPEFLETQITYKEGSTFALFYRLDGYRRAYVVTDSCNAPYLPSVNLPGVNRPIKILYKCTGRKFDNLKKDILLLQKIDLYEPFNLGSAFWLKLTAMINNNCFKSDIVDFYQEYKEMQNERNQRIS